jgi:hypothetical protein
VGHQRRPAPALAEERDGGPAAPNGPAPRRGRSAVAGGGVTGD